jgi:hypothetical protein
MAVGQTLGQRCFGRSRRSSLTRGIKGHVFIIEMVTGMDEMQSAGDQARHQTPFAEWLSD